MGLREKTTGLKKHNNMVVKTRSGSEIRLCNDCEVNYNITDGIHAICMTPMFAGQTSKFYSYAEHSCHMFDYITENLEEIFTELSKTTLKCLIQGSQYLTYQKKTFYCTL